MAFSWKDWYRGLCGLILMMAVIEHPDMPKTIFGIPGLNPWNLMFANSMMAWLYQRGKEGLRWDMPRHVAVMLALYLGVVIVSFGRMITSDTAIVEFYFDGNAIQLRSASRLGRRDFGVNRARVEKLRRMLTRPQP